jgi:alcohol dehydrogenase class IV
LGSIGKLISDPGPKFAIITNPKVGSLYSEQVAHGLDASGLEQFVFEVADAETAKSLDSAKRLYTELSENGFDRDSCIIGLGGGVVGRGARGAAGGKTRAGESGALLPLEWRPPPPLRSLTHLREFALVVQRA